MTENIDPLKKALAENGNYDPEKAKPLAAEATSWFDSRIKRAARIMWIEIIVCIAVFEFAFHGFFFATGAKGMIGFAMMLVIVVVIILSVKLHYSITSTKLTLLKEIKLLQLGNSGQSISQSNVPAGKLAFSAPSLWRTLTPMENVRWFLALMLVALTFSFGSVKFMEQRTLAVDSHVKLLPDGSGSIETKRWYNYYGIFPMTSSSLYTGGACNITHWMDNRGRELPISVAEIDGNRQYTVQLIEPVTPCAEVNDTTIIEGPNLAKQQGDIWTYQGDPIYGYEKNIYLQTITLPKGAEIISVEPSPNRQFVQDDSPTVVLQATRGSNEKFAYTIQYKLAK